MSETKDLEIPEEFSKIMTDFINDIKTTFPEYEEFINKWWKPSDYLEIEDLEQRANAIKLDKESKVKTLYKHCINVYPEKFLDILYQNNDIFGKESTSSTEFLPGISFRFLWNNNISEKTRETIWKYLQLILITIVGKVNNKDMFGDTAKLFEKINEEDFRNKLEETLENMQNIFNGTGSEGGENGNTNASEGSTFNMNNMPNADEIHNHITGMLGGKLGNLAREIAEETAQNLNMNFDDVKDVKDVFQTLFKNPNKLMGLVKNVGEKLDSRIKSGEINESELMSEASDIMNRMKNMPGMDNIQGILSQLGMNGMNIPGMGGRKQKVNVNAMEAKLNQNIKMAQMKERIKKKAEMKQQEQAQNVILNPQPTISEEELISIFSTGEKVEKTPRNAKPPGEGKKKKKGKK
jgi:hypothetical protein